MATGPQGQGKIEDVAVTCLKKMGIAQVLIVVTGGCAQKGFYFGGIDLPLLSNPTIFFFWLFLMGCLESCIYTFPLGPTDSQPPFLVFIGKILRVKPPRIS